MCDVTDHIHVRTSGTFLVFNITKKNIRAACEIDLNDRHVESNVCVLLCIFHRIPPQNTVHKVPNSIPFLSD